MAERYTCFTGHTVVVVQQGGRRERVRFDISGGKVDISVQAAASPLPARAAVQRPLPLMSLR